MELATFFLEQMEREAVANRKVLERVPDGHNSWKPHQKSMELGYLAVLVASMPRWVALVIDRDEVDLNSSGASLSAKSVDTRAELLSLLDRSVAEGRRALETASEDHLMKHWRLVMGAQVIIDEPRYAAIADSTLGHLAHHRGQLTVYLRLLDAKVPAIYGPSADEAV